MLPLLSAGRRDAANPHQLAGGRAHFELFACDLVIDDGLTAHLMEVNSPRSRREFAEISLSMMASPRT